MATSGSGKIGSALGATRGDDDIARAAREAAGARYEVIGELGRSDRGHVALLGRDRELDALVVLSLERDGGSLFDRGSYAATIHPELNDALPLSDVECPVCSVALTSWARLCPNCWSDVAGIAAGPDEGTTAADLLADARRLSQGKCTVLGHLTRADGGGAVYFGRGVSGGRVIAFRLLERQSPSGETKRVVSPIRELAPVALSEASPPVVDAPRPPRPTPSRTSVRMADPTPGARLAIARAWPSSLSRRQLTFGGAALAVVVVAVLLLAVRGGDGTGGSADSSGVTPAGATLPPSTTPKDSGEILIGGAMPEGSVVTLNGLVLGNRRLVLAPGVYIFSITAPGYIPLEHRVSLRAGDEVVWTPRLERAETAATSNESPRRSSTTGRSTATTRSTRSTTAPAATSAGSCVNLYAASRWQAAAQQCAREADRGSAAAQLRVGLLYLHGRAAPQNDELAAGWFHRAASKGNAQAQYQLGVLTLEGRGVERSSREAAQLFLAAAKSGVPNAQLEIGRSYERGDGISRDRAEAVRWYKAAIAQGNVPAKSYLGMLLIEGKDVPRDTVQGISLLRSAATQGFVEAQANLGLLLVSGRGVARNEREAAVWLKRAADAGNKSAAKALRDLERKKK